MWFSHQKIDTHNKFPVVNSSGDGVIALIWGYFLIPVDSLVTSTGKLR